MGFFGIGEKKGGTLHAYDRMQSRLTSTHTAKLATEYKTKAEGQFDTPFKISSDRGEKTFYVTAQAAAELEKFRAENEMASFAVK